MTVEDRDLGWRGIVSSLKMLNKGYTKVGIMEGEKPKNSEDSQLTIADYAIWNEFGTSTIPSRPFMRTAFDKNKAKLGRIVDMQYLKVLRGASPKKALGIVGLFFEEDVKKSIEHGSWVPNAPSTIRRKRNPSPTKAQSSESPQVLKDTGSMLKAVTHVEVFK